MALQQAQAFAVQLAVHDALVKEQEQEGHFTAEVEINDYQEQARREVTMRVWPVWGRMLLKTWVVVVVWICCNGCDERLGLLWSGLPPPAQKMPWDRVKA